MTMANTFDASAFWRRALGSDWGWIWGLGLAGTVALWAVPARAQVDFAPPATFAAGAAPYAAALGDLDDDGDLDIVTANSNSDDVSVLLGDGRGGFAAVGTFAVGGSAPESVALGDIDGDGDLDIVTADSNFNAAGLSVLANQGNGSFAAPNRLVVAGFPDFVTLGDVDNDTDVDILAVASNGGNLTVLFNDGSGGFAMSTTDSVGELPQSAGLGDVDADGDLDIAVVDSRADQVSVLLNDGRGGFAPAGNFAVDGPTSLALGDVDGDGDLDIVTANYFSDTGGGVAVLLGDGRGNFGPRRDFLASGASFAGLTDLDSDGDLDIVSNDAGANQALVLLGNGRANFTVATPFATGGVGPFGVALGDIDADGNPDIVAANVGSDNVAVLLNTFELGAAPTITALNLPFGRPGVGVFIHGTGFTGVSSVTFEKLGPGRVPAQFTVVSSTEINAVVPVGTASGRIVVTTASGKIAISPQRFTAVRPPFGK